MPSCTVPTLSNKLVVSHITQCDMPCSRSAMAVAAATAPAPTWPWLHSHSDMPAMPRINPMLSAWFTISNDDTSRIWVWPVCMNSCMADRANAASRWVCENSLTVLMLV